MDVMIQFFNTVGQENTANMTVKDCLDTLPRLQEQNGPATRAKLPTHQHLQKDNTPVVVVRGKQINDAVFMDLDKDKRVNSAQYCNGGRWIFYLFLLSTFSQGQFVSGFAQGPLQSIIIV